MGDVAAQTEASTKALNRAHYAAAAARYEASNPIVMREVQELCDHYDVGEKAVELDQILKRRNPETLEDDILGLWDHLANARSPGGMLLTKMREMVAGQYVGRVRPDKDVSVLVKKYKLDEEATTKLATILQSKSESDKMALIADVDAQLEVVARPSPKVMMMLKKLRDGVPLGEPSRRIEPGSYADKQQQRSRGNRSRSRTPKMRYDDERDDRKDRRREDRRRRSDSRESSRSRRRRRSR